MTAHSCRAAGIRWNYPIVGANLDLAATPQIHNMATLEIRLSQINTMPVATIDDRKHPIYSVSPREPL
jgi:hypothetical protein